MGVREGGGWAGGLGLGVDLSRCFGHFAREPVWPSGKAGKRRNLGSNPLRLSFLFKSCGLWALSRDFVPYS